MSTHSFLLLVLATCICGTNGEPSRTRPGTSAARHGDVSKADTTGDTANWMLLPGGDGKSYYVDINKPAEKIGVKKSDVIFLLYTGSNCESPETMITGDPSTMGSFNNSRPTRMGIHGWMASPDSLKVVCNGWLQTGKYNVIMVDWSRPASHLRYSTSKNLVVPVGTICAKFMDYLVAQGASREDMEIAGHSLGAHVAGVAGNRVAAPIGRITGLDPAKALFENDKLADRIDSSDAKFVQIIHTSIVGMPHQIGHVDFFPNGGKHQPGCNIIFDAQCSHTRAYELYGESANTTVGFWSIQCDCYKKFEDGACSNNSKVLMGVNTPSDTTGTYYLDTKSSPPYAAGDDQ